MANDPDQRPENTNRKQKFVPPLITLFVAGLPKGQPRPRAFAMKTKGGGYTARVFDAGTAEGWKSEIAQTWKGVVPATPIITEPVALFLTFLMPRPKSHFTKKGLRPDAPRWCAKKPDADNLSKAVMDCLSVIGVWQDDDQVVVLQAEKKFANPDEQSGCEIILCDPVEE